MSDCYAQAATRHLHDARLLLNNSRCDNAVYLAGYVAECCLKAVIELVEQKAGIQKTDLRQYGHNLRRLQNEGLSRAIRLNAKVHSYAPYAPVIAIGSTDLAHGHPYRRYWVTGSWNLTSARKVLNLAETVYRDTLIQLVLDGHLRRESLG